MQFDFDPANLFGIVPDKEQLAAITAPMGVNIVLAGPGSGKSTVIICRILYLVKVKKVNPEDITVLVFNRDAKESLSKRMKTACDRLSFVMPEICTIHSKCYKIVREQSLNYPQIVHQSIHRYRKDLTEFAVTSVKEGDFIRLEETVSRIRENRLQPCSLEDPCFGNLEPIMNLLDSKLERAESVTFEEMSQQALSILSKSDHRVGHLLVDEAQDITEMQFQIIRSLSDRGNRDLFMVGDSDQCIYSFRHASSRYIEHPEKYFNSYCKHLIGTNYRSTEQIVNTAAGFIGEAIPDGFRPCLRAAPERTGPLPQVRRVSRQIDQFRLLVDIALECKAADSKCCAIYRNNSTGVALANYLLTREIWPAHIGGGGEFFKNTAVKKILSRVKGEIVGRKKGYLEHPEMLIRHIALSEKIIPEAVTMAVREKLPKTNFIHEYNQLLNIAGSCSDGAHFLNRVDALQELMNGPGMPGSTITIATAHSVKGLEFDTVLLLDMVEGIFPGGSEDRDSLDDKSEARLMYVAMTRASRRLIMLWPDKIGDRRCTKSRYLARIEQILFEGGKGGP